MAHPLIRITKHLFITFAIVACTLSPVAGREISVRLDEDSGTIGKYLVGLHFVYSEEKDAYYADDSFARWARQAGVTTARYPGGTVVKHWDWKNPAGYKKQGFQDDPDLTAAPPSQWMSLDEYLHFAEVSGITPLIGINILSGVLHDRVDDSVESASEEVKYVVSRGFKGAFYYLGNEDMGQMGGIEKAARIFVRHAKAIKAVDPTAKLLWNDNHVDEKRMQKFLAIADGYADGVEFHGKWPYGGKKYRNIVSLAEWQQHFPFSAMDKGRYSERALALRRRAAELGYPNLMFANNEYGLSQYPQDRFSGFDRFDYGLVAIEFLQDLYIGRFDMAAFWSTVPDDKEKGGARAERRLINTDFGNRLNPLHFGFEMLSSAQGKRLVRIEGGGPDGYGFGALSEDRLEVFLLNKSSASNNIDIRLVGKTPIAEEGRMTSLVDTPDHFGKLEETPVTVDGKSIELVLPPLSYSKIVLPVVQKVTRTN